MTIIEEIKQKYPYLFEKQVCKICGKEFYFKKRQIEQKYCSLKLNKTILIACCRSHNAILQNKLIGNPSKNPEVIKKRILTGLSNIDENGLNSYQRGAIKSNKTKSETILENGLNINKNIALKTMKTRLSKPLIDGLNDFQIAAKKAKNTKINTINEDGLNIYEVIVKKVQQTKEEKYNDPNFVNINKQRQTIQHKYGKNSYFETDEFKEKSDRTQLEKYGRTHFTNPLKAAITKAIKYNNKNYNNHDSYKKTLLSKRGVDHYSKTKEFKDLWKNKDFVKRVAQKIYETKKKNKSFNRRSKQEIRCYELLKTKFPDAEHSYRDSERYPFNCDMYIPSLDLFIECHFGFAHGGEPFDPSNIKHLQEIEKCKIKQEELRFDGRKKNSYAEKIKVWTESDPLKLKTFLDNKLNFKIFYTEKEFLDWLNKYIF